MENFISLILYNMYSKLFKGDSCRLITNLKYSDVSSKLIIKDGSGNFTYFSSRRPDHIMNRLY